MSKIYGALLYLAIGTVAYLVAGDLGGPAGVALAQTGGGPCDDTLCCGNVGSCQTCCGYEAPCCCNSLTDPCIIDESYYYGICDGDTC